MMRVDKLEEIDAMRHEVWHKDNYFCQPIVNLASDRCNTMQCVTICDG